MPFLLAYQASQLTLKKMSTEEPLVTITTALAGGFKSESLYVGKVRKCCLSSEPLQRPTRQADQARS